MSDALSRIGEVVARGVQPLIAQVTAGDGSGEQLVRQLGFLTEPVPAIVATLPLAASGLQSALQDLDAARDAASSSNGPQSAVDSALLEVFGAVIAVAASVQAIEQGAPELPSFEDKFYQLVLVSAVETLRPTLAFLLYFLGIFTRTVGTIVEVGENNEVVSKGVRFDRIGTALRDLPGLFLDVYGWGTAAIDTANLFGNAADLANALGLPFRLEYPADEALTSFGITVADESLMPQQLAVPLGVFDVGEIDLDVFAVPTASPTDVQALAFVLEVTTGGDQTLEISGQTTLTVSANGSVDSGIGMIWHPGTAPQLTGNVLGTGVPSAEGSVSVELATTGFVPPGQDQADEQSIVAVGGGSSLTAQTLKVAAAVTVGGANDDVSVSASLVGGHASISASDGDGFLGAVFPSAPLDAHFDAALSWSRRSGVHFTASGGLEMAVPLGLQIGPLKVNVLRLKADVAGKVAVLLTIDVTATLGPVAATVSEVGAQLSLVFDQGNLGPFDVSAGFAPPTGIGLAIDAGSVHGGGFISFDPTAGRYSGALQLSIYDIAVGAFGLVDTKVPGVNYSFVIIISAQFTPIQLGFGFTLNAVGGMVGINRAIDTTALANLVRAGQSEELLFPKNVVADAPTIVRDLTTVFPATQGHYVFGPLAKLGWGTPTLITGEIGVILEFPGPVVVILGEVKCILPQSSAALVKLNLSVDGELDFPNKTFAMDAALHDSVINGFPVSGQMAMRVAWGDQPNFVFSIGGFHPAYTPPPNFPKLQPMTLDLGSHGPAKISVSGFFAVTSNTVQVGGTASLHASGSGLSFDASVSVKALFVFQPFSFEADIDASVKVSFHGYGPSVHLSGTLDGPSPWHVKGEVCVSVLWWDACLGFDVTFGGDQQVTQPSIDPWLPADTSIIGLQQALSDPGNWSGALVPGTVSSVTRVQGTDTLVDPVGGLTVRQKTAPVETANPLTKFGVARTTAPISFSTVQATLGTGSQTVGLTAVQPVNEFFAPAQFFDMDDAKKLSSAGFEQYQAGYLFATAEGRNAEGGSTVNFQPVMQTILINSDGSDTLLTNVNYTPSDGKVTAANERSAVAKGGLTQAGTRRFVDRAFTEAFSERLPTFVIGSSATLDLPTVTVPAPAVRSATLIALDVFRAGNTEQAAGVQVTALYDMPNPSAG